MMQGMVIDMNDEQLHPLGQLQGVTSPYRQNRQDGRGHSSNRKPGDAGITLISPPVKKLLATRRRSLSRQAVLVYGPRRAGANRANRRCSLYAFPYAGQLSDHLRLLDDMRLDMLNLLRIEMFEFA